MVCSLATKGQSQTTLKYDGNTNTDSSATVEDIESAIKNFKKGKAVGADHIVPEHIIYSHPCIVVHLKILFHTMLLNGYVPDSVWKE